MYNILACDGGGIRSVFTAAILRRICDKFPEFLNHANLFSGTSGGSIVAGGLAYGYTPKRIEELFVTYGKDIFKVDEARNKTNWIGLLRAKYDNEGVLGALLANFGQIKLADLPHKVLIPTFNINYQTSDGKRQWRPKIFHNFDGPFSSPEEMLYKVVARSSAAPVYFPSIDGYIDGGIFANNPAMAAVSEAIRPYSGNQKIENIRVLSIGTGLQPNYIQKDDNDWGKLLWLKNQKLLDLLFDGSVGAIHYYCESLLGVHYYRYNTQISTIKLDDAEKTGELIVLADSLDLTDLFSWIESFWFQKG